jgi:hypothetical protein
MQEENGLAGANARVVQADAVDFYKAVMNLLCVCVGGIRHGLSLPLRFGYHALHVFLREELRD